MTFVCSTWRGWFFFFFFFFKDVSNFNINSYHAGPAIRRARVPTHNGPPKTVQFPIYLNVPALQQSSRITFDERFSLKELKFYLCTKMSQPPFRCRLMIRRASMVATEIVNDEDMRTIFESNLCSGDFVGVQRDGQPDRIETSNSPPLHSSYAATSAQMGITSAEDEIRASMNVRDNYYYDPAYPTSSRYAGDMIRPVSTLRLLLLLLFLLIFFFFLVGASRQHGPTTQSYYPDYDEELAAAIAASLQDTPPAATPAPSTVTTTTPAAPPTAPPIYMPALLPVSRTEHRPIVEPHAQWLDGDDDDDTEDDP